MTLKSLFTLCLLIFLVQIVGVCSYASRPYSDPPRTLIVENLNWANATVHVFCDSKRASLISGIRTGESRPTHIRRSECHELTLLITLLADPETWLIEPFVMAPGECVRLTIQNHLPLSSILPCRPSTTRNAQS